MYKQLVNRPNKKQFPPKTKQTLTWHASFTSTNGKSTEPVATGVSTAVNTTDAPAASEKHEGDNVSRGLPRDAGPLEKNSGGRSDKASASAGLSASSDIRNAKNPHTGTQKAEIRWAASIRQCERCRPGCAEQARAARHVAGQVHARRRPLGNDLNTEAASALRHETQVHTMKKDGVCRQSNSRRETEERNDEGR